MRRVLSVAFLASAMIAGSSIAAELKSGLQPGGDIPAYNGNGETGPGGA